MSLQERKAMMRRAHDEAWNKGNVDAMDEILAPDFVQHRPPLPDIEGLEAYKQHVKDMRTAFPDIQFTIDETIIEGDAGADRWTLRATRTGQSPAFPFPPTGKQVVLTGCGVYHTVGGKLIEEWLGCDIFGMFQQLGIAPPTEQSVE